MFTKNDLVTQFKNLGIKPGDTVLVHSSFKAIGSCENGPQTIIESLTETLTEKGTLLMPSFQGGAQYDLLSNFPGFHSKSTPSELGVITEIFRKISGVQRSLSPTHSLCGLGLHAKKILEDHHKCLVTAGRKSPFEKLIKYKAKILLLGVDHKANTFLHYLENCNGAPTLSAKSFQVEIHDENEQAINCKVHPHLPGLPRNYQRLNTELNAPIQITGKIGNAKSFLIKTHELAPYLINKLKENPLYLINPFEPDHP